ncbi:MAG: M56 family metallopeptidase [Candidatus Pseudobacter hemicellulosilyticus]|uniref:M56 family metallopeptidase n=1 Tax=Candidatus Pseudobacter hemicellulosilyticus TaxID=3121375 RepID=A0AAJ5WQV9_9BACT|nr:MAG: M56 family metallopeptidase [Pseudobacter sp.]
MEQVYQSAFLKALGWSLLDSLWQMGLLWLFYVLLTANGKRFSAARRHGLALLSLAGGSAWFLVNLVVQLYRAAAAPRMISLAETTSATYPHLLTRASDAIEPFLPALSILYLFMTVFLLIRLYRQYHITNRLLRVGRTKAEPTLRIFLQQAAVHLGIQKKVSLWLSTVADAPLTIGFWKPVILLPVAAVTRLSLAQTEAIILHELQHIRRNDYLVNLLIAFTEVLFFFNPFSRWMAAAIRQEREHSCDDLVLQFRYDAAGYAQSLLLLEQSRQQAVPALAIAATGKNTPLLLHRVRRILYQEPVNTPLGIRFAAFFTSALLIGLIGWYNPGNVIAESIRPVAPLAAVTPEYAGEFVTPEEPAAEEKINHAPARLAAPVPDQQPVAAVEPITKSHQELETRYLNSLLELQEINTAMNTMLANLDRRQQALTLESQGSIAKFVSEANTGQTLEFSLQLQQPAREPVQGSAEIKPYVPSSSYHYQLMEDTTLPKRIIASTTDRQAREAMEQSLRGLQAVNWNKLQQQLQAAGQKVDVRQLQALVKQAMADVDWKQLNEEAQAARKEGLRAAQDALTAQQDAWRAKLENFQRERAKKQAEIEKLRQEILMERLQENQDVPVNGKKTVDI